LADVQSIIVVVPCYNEAQRFQPEHFFAAARQHAGVNFILVDDGSRDTTRDVIGRLEREQPDRFMALGLDQNQGKAEAVRQGMNLALARAPDLVAYFDADLATPLAELEPMRSLFAQRPELQMVLGSRVAMLGREVTRSHQRHYLGRVFASAASLSLGLTVYDTQCGAKMFRDTAAVRTVFAHPFRSRWAFDVEILARMKALAKEGVIPELERAIVEHPLSRWRDVSGSKLSTRAAIGAAAELAKVWIRYGRGWRR
jgi:dolichyl-phosphate beta-glucosyltransferase